MSAHPSTLAALRSLLAAHGPEKSRARGAAVPTGIAALDECLGGGLAAGRLTELVCPAAGSGGQSVLRQLLRTTRRARQRVALVDAADSFAPEALPDDDLRHLVWVRCPRPETAFAAADLLVRDGNYAVIVLDLRGVPARRLQGTPTGVWTRLRLAAEGNPAAVLVPTEVAVVPAVPWRLHLGGARPLAEAEAPPEAVLAALGFTPERQAPAVAWEAAG